MWYLCCLSSLFQNCVVVHIDDVLNPTSLELKVHLGPSDTDYLFLEDLLFLC